EVGARTRGGGRAGGAAGGAGRGRRGGGGGPPPAMSAPTPARTPQTRANANPTGSATPRNTSVDTPKAPSAPTREPGHPTRRVAAPYARQNDASETSPKSVPSAARAANSGPCSRARTKETGPQVSGSPANHPPTAGRHPPP